MFLFSACALCASLATSPTPSPAPSGTPLPQIAHVYTSDRGDATIQNTARTIYVVTRAQIDRDGYRTVAQALSGVPALTISPFGPIGSTVDYSLRGSGSAQVLVLVDGLPAPGSFSNNVELGNIPTMGVDRIEVVEGGGSTLYGTGAIGGVINIITARASAAGAKLQDGSFGDRQIEIDTPHVQFTRTVANNGFALPDGAVRSDVDYESSALRANGERRIGAFDAVLRAGVESDHLGAPGPDGSFSPSSRESDVNENADLTLAHASAQSQATVQLGGTNQQILFSCDPVNDSNCFFPVPGLSKEGRLDFGARNAVRAAHEQLLYGVDLARGTVRSDSSGYAAPPVSVNALAQSAAYVQEHADAHAGSFYAGLRGERDGSLGGEISPSAGFVLHVSGSLSFKGNIATAFRAPNATELYFPGYGNPGVKAERAKVADVTLIDEAPRGGMSLGWFGNRTNDLIVGEPVSVPGPGCTIDPAAFTYQACNVGHALIEGVTFTAHTAPYNGFTTALSLTDLYRAQNIDTGARLPNDPVIGANLRLDYVSASPQSALAALGVAMRMTGARGAADTSQPLFDRAVPFTSVDAYARFRAGRSAFLTLRGYDLGNERAAAVNGYPLPGRSFAVELSTK